MIVWGYSAFLQIDGASYDPQSDSWQPISLAGGPVNRDLHSAVWTGSEMIVWGGRDFTTGVATGVVNTGAIYNPVTDTWRPMTTNGAPSARGSHTAVWTGTEMIVWGGDDIAVKTNTGGRYNPAADSWQATTISNAPSDRTSHSAVWTGTEMVIWGGWRSVTNSFQVLNTGGRNDPATDSWQATTTVDSPSARSSHLALWTGSEMFIWGGDNNNVPAAVGGRYDPSTDKWGQLETSSAPSVKPGHKAVWTGKTMVVWGCDGFSCTGGRFIP